MTRELFVVDSNADIVSFDYVDKAILIVALDVIDDAEVGVSGYGYRGSSESCLSSKATGKEVISERKFEFEFHRYALNGDGYHVGTELCSVEIPIFWRCDLGLYVNKAMRAVDEDHAFMVRLDDVMFTMQIKPAEDDQCLTCEHKDNDADNGRDSPCEGCNKYEPMGEEEWWEMEVKALAEKIRAEVLKWKWEYVKNIGWEIVPVLANPASHTNPDYRA